MKSLIKPLLISVGTLLLLNTFAFWLFDQNASALLIFSGSALLAFGVAFGGFYKGYTEPLWKVIQLVHEDLPFLIQSQHNLDLYFRLTLEQ